MLKIRRFIQGKDEATWIDMVNKTFMEFEDFRTSTVEEMLNDEESPGFDSAGMFIAELDGEAAGLVNTYEDKKREEKKGFIRVLGVVPEHRRKGIGRMLAEKALQNLKERKWKQWKSRCSAASQTQFSFWKTWVSREYGSSA